MANGPRLFIDIRSGSVGACVANPGRTPGTHDVCYCKRRNLPILQTFKGERLLSTMLTEIREILKDVRTSNLGSITKVHVTIASPWFFSETKTIKHVSDIATKCDRDWLRQAVESEISEFLSRNFSKRMPEIVEKDIVRVSLNGYETMRPYGKFAKEQVFTLYASAVETATINTIRRAVSEIFGTHNISMHTMPMAALPAVASVVSPDINSYLVLDIGGEVSEFFLIRDRLISDSFSIPIGAHSVLRDMAHDLKSSTEEARAIYAAFGDGELDATIIKRVKSSLELTEIGWRTYVKGILEKISDNYILPPVVVLICTEPTGDIFKKVLGNQQIAELFPQKMSPIVLRPDPKTMGLNYVGKGGTSRDDIFLAVEISSIDKAGFLKYA